MSLRMLIVDDSLAMRKLLQRQVRLAGFADAEIVEAADGREGLERFDPRAIDILLTDVNMPEMDGFALVREARRKQRETPDSRPVRILMISAEGEPAVVQAAQDCGADDLLVKPFSPQTLGGKLAGLLAQRAPEK